MQYSIFTRIIHHIRIATSLLSHISIKSSWKLGEKYTEGQKAQKDCLKGTITRDSPGRLLSAPSYLTMGFLGFRSREDADGDILIHNIHASLAINRL